MQTHRVRAWICLAGTLILVTGLGLLDASGRARHLVAVSAVRLADPLAVPSPGTPSGFPAGSHDELLPASGTDGYQWIIHTQDMVDRGAWRLHHTEIDNPPGGRDVHWSSGLMWWLALLGRVRAAATGIGPREGLERGALFASPILFICFLIPLSIAVFRRFGIFPACALAFAFGTAPRLGEFFQGGYVDHHGIAAVAGLATVLFAAASGAGWSRVGGVSRTGDSAPTKNRDPECDVPSDRGARRWIVASGVAGAAGLWVSAASQAPILVGLGLGALVGASRWNGPSPSSPGLAYSPRIWRTWGWTLAGGSLFFYLLEYFPSSMGMRLEVNHPLYAVACAGAGELLFHACRRLRGGRLVETHRDPVRLALAVVAVAVLPVTVAVAADRVFWVSNPFLWALHRDISEFHSLARALSDFGFVGCLRSISLLPLLLLPVLWVPGRARLAGARWGMLTVAATPALLVTMLASLQVRWLGNEEALWIAVLAVWVFLVTDSRAGQPARGRRIAWLFLALLALQAAPAAVSAATRGKHGTVQLLLEDRLQLVMRDVAQRIRREGGAETPTVLTGPTSSTALVYFGGLKGVGTLYWENREGLEAAAAIYGATTDGEALRLLEGRGITRLVTFSWEDYGEKMARLDRGLAPGTPVVDAFAYRLKSPETLPRWLRPIRYEIPPDLGLAGQAVVILEVRPADTAEEHLSDLAEYYLGGGDYAGASAAYFRLLELHPDRADLLVGLARTLVLSGRVPEGMQRVERAIAVTPAAGTVALANDISGIGQRLSPADPRGAIRLYRRALELDPSCRIAMNNLAWVLATSLDETIADGAEAARLASSVVGLDGGADPLSLDTLAAAYARAGRWPDAVATASRAVELAEAKGTRGLDDMRARLALYRAGKPYRQPARPIPSR